MFTVLIAEKEHIDAIQQENRLFFEPFLNNKELAFCYWNPQGQCLEDAVPGLLDTVGRTKEWRAVIINNVSAECLKAQNPFDVVDTTALFELTAPAAQYDEKEPFDQWEAKWKTYYAGMSQAKEKAYREAITYPLQRLTTWLCYRPEKYVLQDVQEKQDIFDWAMGELYKDGRKEANACLEQMERQQYKYELRLKEQIRKDFLGTDFLNVAYPAEIHCISARTADNGFFDPDDYWNIRWDSDYSGFADRNMYFDKMRFLVIDLLARSHRNFRTDYIRFLASILIFVSNPAPGSAMQARRLYRLETETDDTPLCTLVTSFDKKLASTFDVIENEMEKIRGEIPDQLTDKVAEELFCTSKDVPVVLDSTCKPDKVLADTEYGLFYDSPVNELYKWNRDRDVSEKALSYIVKQQARSVRKSVSQMHLTSEVNDVHISRLTSFQMDDVRDFTDNAENEMVESMPPDLSDISRYTKRLDAESKEVKKVIGRRMTQKTGLILGAVCLGLFLICFLPFLLDNNGTTKSISTAILLSGGLLAALAVILFVSLLVMRSKVRNAVRGYNNTARSILSEIEESLGCFSKYLSCSSNVRRGHFIQNYSSEKMDRYTKSLRIRKKHQEDIRRKRAYLAEEYRDYFGDKSFCDETMSRPYDYDFDQTAEFDYPAPFLAGDFRQIEFLCSGNYVSVPSSYVTRLLVRMEGLYDK